VNNVGLIIKESKEFSKTLFTMSTLLTAVASLNWVALFFGLIVVNRKLSSTTPGSNHGNILDGSSTIRSVNIDNLEPENNLEKDDKEDEFRNKIEVD
jgi:hypothetical protein